MPPSLRTARPRLRLAAGIAVGQAAGRGALALGLLVLVRTLRPEDFGDLVLALALVQILATLADAGFGRLLVRDVARSGDAAALVRELLVVRLAAVLGVVGLAALLLLITPNPFGLTVAVLLLSYLATESVAFGFENAAVGSERPSRFVLAQSVAAVALLGGLAVLAATGRVSIMSASAVLAGSSALKVIGHLLAWRTGFRSAGRGAVRRPRAALWREALPFLGLTLLATVYYRVGVIALHVVQGARETASYGAALRVVDAVAVVAGVVFAAISPTLSRAHRNSPGAIWELWKRMVVRCAVVVVPLAAVTVVVAPQLARLLFGPDYEQSAGADLRLLAPGAALLVVQSLSAAVVFMADDHRDVLRLTAVNVIACVAASLALASAFGSSGAALALTLAEALSFASFAVLIRRRYRRPAVDDGPPAQPAAPAPLP